MRFKKSLAILLAVCFACSAMAMVASADGEVTVAGASYTVISPKKVTLTGEDVALDDRGKDLSVLYDGDAGHSITNYDQPGLVMLANQQVVTRKATESPVKVADEDIPTASFEMDFGGEVTFDTAYISIFFQSVGIGEPADNCVIVETSADGKTYAPVGDDGKFYYSLPKAPDYDATINGGNGNPFAGEVAVPLGETVKSRYVRFSFKFAAVPDEIHWSFYTNVYEFMDFAEMGVATYQDGRKPKQLTREDVAAYPAVGGDWFVDLGETLEVWTVSGLGDMKITKKTYDKAAYLADAKVEPTETNDDLSYYVQDQTTFLLFEDGGYDEYSYAVGTDGNLTLTLDGDETLLLTAENFKKANPSASSGASTSGTSSAASSAASSASSASSASTSSSRAPTSTGASAGTSSGAEGGGISTMGIVLLVAAAVVIVAAVVIIIVVVRKKKK